MSKSAAQRIAEESNANAGIEPGIRIDAQGVAWINGTTTKVIEVVLDQLAYNLTPEQMLREHPHWSLHQIEAALRYYETHKSEIDTQIAIRLEQVDTMALRSKSTLTRHQLEQRRNHSR
jgi:uncharacterized protein (DUF433 family)